MTRHRLSALLVALAALLLVVLGAAPAKAIDLPNPVGGVGDAILDKICPPRDAPYPASPGAPVIKRGGGPGLYAQYGYAGLRWTTWDAGCLSWDKADTSMGTTINGMANAVDETINEVQIAALDDSTTASFDVVIERAVAGLRDAFWNPWSALGLSVVGLLVVGYMLSGRETDALSAAVSALVVIGALFLLFSRPGLPAEVGNGMTSGVAQGVAESLIAVTPGGTMPDTATPEEKFGEGFYQVSYRAWLEGWSCGDTDAEQRYGRRLLDAQAFSVEQYLSTRGNPAAARALVKSKGEAWVRVGEEMGKSNPVAFGCWKGEGQSRTGAAVKHAVVTISAGFWIFLGSVALLALKWVLRIAVLFAVSFGAVMLFSRRLQDRMMEFVLLGLLGPAIVAAGVGVLLWGYYAILLSDQAWWQAGVSAFALGLALWFSKGILQRMFVGVREVSRGGSMARSGGRKVRNTAAQYGVGTWNGPPSQRGAAAAAAGGAAAGAAAATVAVLSSDDNRRADADTYSAAPTQEDDGMDAPRQPDPTDAPAVALARAHAMAAARGDEPAGFGALPHDEPPTVSDDNPRTEPSGSVALAPTVEELRGVVSGEPYRPPERTELPQDADYSPTGDPEYGRGDS